MEPMRESRLEVTGTSSVSGSKWGHGCGTRGCLYWKCPCTCKRRTENSTAEDRDAEEVTGKPGSSNSESRRKGVQEGGICMPVSVCAESPWLLPSFPVF